MRHRENNGYQIILQMSNTTHTHTHSNPQKDSNIAKLLQNVTPFSLVDRYQSINTARRHIPEHNNFDISHPDEPHI